MPRSRRNAPSRPEFEPADPWNVRLGDERDPDLWPAPAPAPARLGPARVRSPLRIGLLGLAVLIGALGLGLGVLNGVKPTQDSARPPVASVVGAHLAVPVRLHVPAGAWATADGSYVGVQLASGSAVLITMPTRVVGASGVVAPLPDDPAAWLESDPAVLVSRVHDVVLGAVRATQVDYRRIDPATLFDTYSRLALFCAPAGRSTLSPTACPQITANARVRATLIPVRGRLVLVEAVWRADDAGAYRPMPRDLERCYTLLLAGITGH